jgi:uncharacterized membrane protein
MNMLPPTPSPASSDTVNRTARLEAFSDGVFSIAITLLVFNIAVPRDLGDGTLVDALLANWQAYFAFFVSFAVIGILWINHHNMFRIIYRGDHTVFILNALLLMLITFINYPTAVLGVYLTDPVNQRAAALLYGGTLLATAIAFNLLWRYVSYKHRLLHPDVNPEIVRSINTQYNAGPFIYLAAFLLAFFTPIGSMIIHFLLALFYALPSNNRLYNDL